METRQKSSSTYRRIYIYAVIAFIILSVISACIVWYIYYLGNIALYSIIKQQEMNSLLVAKERLLLEMKAVMSDLNYLSNSDFLKSSPYSKENLADIRDELQSFIDVKKKYGTIIYLSENKETLLQVTSSGQLLNKAEQEKLIDDQRILNLGKREVFVGRFDVKGENGNPASSLQVINFAKLVFDDKGNEIGTIVLSYMAQDMIDHISDKHHLLDSNGSWLKKGMIADLAQAGKKTYAEAYPEQWQWVSKLKYGHILGDQAMLSFCSLFPFGQLMEQDSPLTFIYDDKDFVWRLVTNMPYIEMNVDFDSRNKKFALLFIGLVGFYGAICVIYASMAIKRKRADEHFRILFKYSEDAHFLLKKGIITDCNDSALMLLGLDSSEELIGREYESLLPEKQNDGRFSIDKIKELEETARRDGFSRSDFVVSNKDGRLFPVEVMVTPVLHEKMRSDIIIWHDLTERKQNELKLLELTEAVERSSAIVVITDKEGIIEYVNPAFTQVTGYKAAEALGQNCSILKSGKTPDNVYQKMWETITTGRNWYGELLNKKKNGEFFWQLLNISPLKNEDGEIVRYVSIQEDISTLKHAEHDLKDAIHRAEEANKSKSEFLANVSHEIRTPMNAILGFSEILSGLIEDRQQLDFLESIRSSGKYLLVLINDILDISKVEAGKLNLEFSAFNLHSLLNEFEQIFADKLKLKELELIIDIDDSVPTHIVLDEVRLRQILINLVGNAIKFTDSGYVKVHTAAKMCDEHPNAVSITFIVEDTGIGIPEDQQDIIFEAFEQQRGPDYRHIGGTGLGLAITKRLVAMLGGSIRLESEIEKGSRFIITIDNVLKATADVFQHPSSASFDINKIKFEPATVLIADDDKSSRHLVKGYLQSSYPELTIVEAENGIEAIEEAKKHQPAIILMDVVMPKMSGIQAIRQIRELEAVKDVAIVALTASIKKDIAALLNKYCNSFLRKPVSKEALVKEIMRFVDHTITDEVRSGLVTDDEIEPEEENFLDMIETGERFATISNIEGFVARFGELLDDNFDVLKKHQMMKQLTEFANHVKALATTFKSPELMGLAKELTDNVDAFDVEKIPETLDQFPALLAELKQFGRNNEFQ